MRIAICDDDILVIKQIECLIKTFFETKSIKCPEIISFSSGESLLADKEAKDILFLDIEMPGINGIYVGKELKRQTIGSLSLLLPLIPNIWTKQCVSMYSVTCQSLWRNSASSVT